MPPSNPAERIAKLIPQVEIPSSLPLEMRAPFIVPTWNVFLAALMFDDVIDLFHVNKLCQLAWRLIGSRTTVMSATETVPTMHFLGLVSGKVTGKHKGLIMAPADFHTQARKDPWNTLGGLTFTASKLRDFWNERLNEKENEDRAYAFEGEVLRLALEFEPDYQLSNYQKLVLEKYPKGSVEKFDYPSIPFDLARAQEKFEDFSKQGIADPLVPTSFAEFEKESVTS